MLLAIKGKTKKGIEASSSLNPLLGGLT